MTTLKELEAQAKQLRRELATVERKISKLKADELRKNKVLLKGKVLQRTKRKDDNGEGYAALANFIINGK